MVTVEKYKPKATPHQIDRRVSDNAAASDRLIASAKGTVERTKALIESSRKAVAKSREATRERKGAR